ncbi:hypothetical protein [Laceyella putida]|uniref:Uncharacterized protein n=1 Tax=Laceyella putida TaxID=110101 RepID=A0ABW2RPD4_9BACL
MKPIRCIECYRQRPGGRCEYCPLHKKNRPLYRHIGDGWYELLPQASANGEPALSADPHPAGPADEDP